MNSIRCRQQDIFKFFEGAYKEHEATFDPSDIRDFVDLYIAERKRANECGLTGSSFNGELGHHNYVNTMWDLFMVRFN